MTAGYDAVKGRAEIDGELIYKGTVVTWKQGALTMTSIRTSRVIACGECSRRRNVLKAGFFSTKACGIGLTCHGSGG